MANLVPISSLSINLLEISRSVANFQRRREFVNQSRGNDFLHSSTQICLRDVVVAERNFFKKTVRAGLDSIPGGKVDARCSLKLLSDSESSSVSYGENKLVSQQ